MRTKRIEKGKTYVGIDNGVSGSIGIAGPCSAAFHHVPVRRYLDYTKEVKHINRVDVDKLRALLAPLSSPFAILERPMINPGRFKATISAVRALEALLIVLEELNIPYMYVDSREWQGDMLPRGLKNSEAKKAASKSIGERLFPQFRGSYKGDADGMLIAEWGKRKRL